MSHCTASHSDSSADAFSYLRSSCSCSHCLTPAPCPPTNSTATFHPFPLLPAELRIQIWELTVEPRIVEVRVVVEHLPPLAESDGSKMSKRSKKSKQWRSFPRVYSPTPVPATLHTCREARRQGLYQQVFSELAAQLGGPSDAEPRYVYLNLNIDMVSVGKTELSLFKPVAHLIRRLRFTRGHCGDDYMWEYWERWESQEVGTFKNTTEIHVVCECGNFWDWCGSSEDVYWPCGVENVSMINPDDGEVMRLLDIDYEYDRSLEDSNNLEDPDELVVFRAGMPYYLGRGDELPDHLYTSVRARPAKEM